MVMTRSKTASTRARVQSLLREMNAHNRRLDKIAKDAKNLEKKAKAEEKALKAKAAQVKAAKSKANREARKQRNAAMSPPRTRSKAKTGGCGCGCDGTKMCI